MHSCELSTRSTEIMQVGTLGRATYKKIHWRKKLPTLMVVYHLRSIYRVFVLN